MAQTSTGHPLSLARQQYPDPWMDIASTRLPKSRKKLLEMCHQFATQHPQISPVVKKLAKYPITKVILKSNNQQDSLEERWREILEDDLDIYAIAEGAGLDYFGYGNCFIIVHKPFIRTYNCKSCGYAHSAGTIKYNIKNKAIIGTCNECDQRTELEAKDEPIDAIDQMNIVRLSPQNMHLRRNEMTGQTSYFYQVPSELKKATSGSNPDREYIDATPWPYVEAALKGKKIKIKSSKILHIYEPSLSGDDMEWGNPITLPALKDAYLNQVYKKADESAANERTLPARFVFPAANSGKGPLQTISLSKFTNFLEHSLNMWRQDKNAVMPVPFPIESAQLGGDAKRFHTAEMRQLQIKEIIGALGVPQGFLSEQMKWSGGSVQLRMLENMLMGYLRSLDKLLNFVVQQASRVVDLPAIDARFKSFRMADDLQKLQMVMQLAEQQQVSYKEVLQRLDLQWNQEHEQIVEELEKKREEKVKDNLIGPRSSLEAADLQVNQQFQQQGFQELKQNVHQDDQAIAEAMQGGENFHEVDEQQEQQQQQQDQERQQQEERQQQAEIAHKEGLGQKYDAESAEKSTRADIARENHQDRHVPQMVESMAEKLVEMPPEAQQQELERLRAEDYTQLADMVEERVEELMERSGIPQDMQEEQSQGEQIVRQLQEQVDGPDQFAKKMVMLDAEPRSAAIQFLKENNPQLLQKVMQEANQ